MLGYGNLLKWWHNLDLLVICSLWLLIFMIVKFFLCNLNLLMLLMYWLSQTFKVSDHMSWCFYIDNYWIVLDIWTVDHKIKCVVVKDFFGNIRYTAIIILKNFKKKIFLIIFFKPKIAVFSVFLNLYSILNTVFYL